MRFSKKNGPSGHRDGVRILSNIDVVGWTIGDCASERVDGDGRTMRWRS